MRMRCRPRVIMLACIAAGVQAASAAAQFTSLPIQVSSNIDPQLRTITVASDVGVARENLPGLRPLALRLTLNLGALSITAGAGVLHGSSANTELTLGGAVGYDLYASSPRRPTLTLQGAVGHGRVREALDDDPIDRWDVPIGLALTWSFPALDLNIEPWVAPRGHVRLVENNLSGGGYETDFGGGTSAGLMLTHAIGPGLHLAMDGLYIDDPRGAGGRIEWVLSAGIHLKLALP